MIVARCESLDKSIKSGYLIRITRKIISLSLFLFFLRALELEKLSLRTAFVMESAYFADSSITTFFVLLLAAGLALLDL